MPQSVDSQSPYWFQRGLDCPSSTHAITVEGVSISYELWDQTSAGSNLPGLVLIHGSNAHLEWWRFIAPMLADQFRVAAIDLSGHGNSGWRERYDGAQLGREVWAVCAAANLGPRPIVVGHSFGGYVALETAAAFSAEMGGVLFMDFTVAAPENYMEWGLRVEREGVDPKRKLRVYDDQAVALGRYRLVPEQPVYYPEVLAHLARKSLKEVAGGWTWKFDPAIFDYMEMGADQQAKLAGITCPMAVVLGEDSQDEAAFHADNMERISDGLLPVFKVPGTHHHLMFDEPVAVAMAMKAIVLSWHQAANAPALRTALDRFTAPGAR
ncbi:MAG: alpha/beta fold hydrolase [Pseudomonadales bacterium]